MAQTWFHRLALIGTVLTLVIVMSGAWVRLTDAGLGCPDWPGCYGRLTPPVSAQEIAESNAAYPGSPVDTGKAWREMIHRYAIPVLGFIVLGLAGIAITTRRDPLMPLWVPLLLLPLLGIQALLGMFTVTLLLQPIIVVAHLLGGMLTLALLGWLTLISRPRPPQLLGENPFRTAALVALLVVFAQVALGGWTSANYAALACPDFPTCQAQWWPDQADFDEAFVPWRGLGVEGDSGSGGRVAIHLAHRIGALVTLFVVGGIALAAALRGRDRATRMAGGAMAVILLAQLALGVTIVLQGLPLALAVAHNGTAALLVLATVSLNYAAWRLA